MHLALGQLEAEGHDAVTLWKAPSGTASPPAITADEPLVSPSVYGTRRIRWPGVLAVIAGHVLVVGLLITFDVVQVPRLKRPPTVVKLIELPTDPPEVLPSAQQEPTPEPVKMTPPPIVSPPPMVRTPVATPASVVTAPEPPPQRAAVVAPQAAPGPTGPVSAPDLSSTMISARPPKYPVESRRKHEQGTVVLTVLVGTSGSVMEVSISRSSGFERLDKAALAAVRNWRWSPTVRGGQPVMVKGFVDIPFVLTT